MEWSEHQEWERGWWGNCTNTFAEESKQISYAYRMGLTVVPSFDGKWPVYDLEGKNILDIGGGPVSMLLKCKNRGPGSCVVDPCDYPDWVYDRYDVAGINWEPLPGEDAHDNFFDNTFDEVWIYNVLQHVKDPATILNNARALAPTLRLFEWLGIPACDGHPHELHQASMDQWTGRTGSIEVMSGENGCWGTAYYISG